MTLLRWSALLALPMALSGCFLTPGVFTSTLDLRRDGSFTFAYKGEVVFESPQDLMGVDDGEAKAVWSDNRAFCESPSTGGTATESASTSTSAEADKTPECTAAQIAEQRREWEAGQKAKAEKRATEAKQFGAIFGFTPGDEEANRKLAATYARYQGYRSVTYRGNGVFDIDYVASGVLTHDFVFPVLPQQDIIFPFVAVRRQADGSARVNAPSLIGGGLRGMAGKLKGLGGNERDMPTSASSRTRGTFTLTTDGEVLTNNTEEGASSGPGGRTLRWDIAPDTQKVPEALIRLRP